MRIRSEQAKCGRLDGFELDVVADDLAKYLLELREDFVQIEQRRLHDLLSAERQQLAGQAAGALPRLLDFLQIRDHVRLIPDRVGEERGVAEDGRQQVVELVRDAARELGNRLHLLRLSDLVLARVQRDLGESPVRRFDANREHLTIASTRDDQGHASDIEPACRARAPIDDGLGGVRGPSDRPHLGVGGRQGPGLFRSRMDIALDPPKQVGDGRVEELRHRAIGHREAAARILEEDQIGIRVEDGSQQLALAPDRGVVGKNRGRVVSGRAQPVQHEGGIFSRVFREEDPNRNSHHHSGRRAPAVAQKCHDMLDPVPSRPQRIWAEFGQAANAVRRTCTGDDGIVRGGSYAAAWELTAGNSIVKRDPSPGSDSHQTRPPNCSSTSRTSDNPSPVPSLSTTSALSAR